MSRREVLIVRMILFYLCVFAHTGQSHGCGGCSCPSGDHSQHASLRGLSVRQPISAPASDGVCTDGKHWIGLERRQDCNTFNTHIYKSTEAEEGGKLQSMYKHKHGEMTLLGSKRQSQWGRVGGP